MELIGELLTACISGGCAFLGAVLTQHKKTAILENEIKHLISDINQLSERVKCHNNLIERLTRVETDIETLKNRRYKQ